MIPPLHRFYPTRLIAVLLLLAPAASWAGSGQLLNCFTQIAHYQATWSYELNPTENQPTSAIDTPELAGSGAPLTAQCDCNGGTSGTSTVDDGIYVTSDLIAGHSSTWAFLTDKIDIDVAGYTDSTGTSPHKAILPIDNYPVTTPTFYNEKGFKDTDQEVCKPGTGPNRDDATPPPTRQFTWNAMSAQFYIKSPISGEEIIPPTEVIKYSVCVFIINGCTSTTFDNAQLVSIITLSGSLSAPLSCTINAGSTIDVDFGNISSTDFTHQGTPPDGFALKDVDITFHCDNASASTSDKIKLTLTADQGVSDVGSGFIAKMVGRDDIGVRMYDTSQNNVPLDGSVDFPVVLDDSGNGHIQMTAAPVATTSNKPAAGKFEGNVTVKMDIR
ncbi:fimbrial protein [Citrobacter amalonaticus]|uniref:fimbrial protein n=1 Tax=Citrobacter amalonaticus TaxID=35703 RepID=UPI00255ACBD4|nr:fimbrial protein [Citrobacter amalonaticus]MDL4618948.1 fimbrial protein [Citrobacter amalonaticus]MDL4623046.1 fimbrial protein [Citrobacter amalonaticus]